MVTSVFFLKSIGLSGKLVHTEDISSIGALNPPIAQLLDDVRYN